jgi:DNA helicase-2/ATP-dependent DNA helicase PcrA
MARASHPSLYDFINTQLNDAQKEAVTHPNGSLLVIAGAGSGKTRVITARIAHLMIEHDVPASQIVALTFTNKAAQEMKERITAFLDPHSAMPFVGTFHSYCLQLLKKYRHLVAVPFNSLLDADDQKKIVTDILKRSNLQKQFSATTLTYQISLIKNSSVQTDITPAHFQNPLIYDIYTAYEKEKTISTCFDFDDLLLHTVTLFKKNSAFKQEFHKTVRHLLVDEYQDTNIVQHTLLKLMALEQKQFIIDSLCAVGDEDQSIYSWRGAHVSNMLGFNKDFPGTTLIKIEQNYRSVQPILQAANSIIEHNTHRNPKKLWSEKKATDRIRLLSCTSEYQEADALAQLSGVVQKNMPIKECAILYRTHAQSRAIEEALIKNSIPYKIIGGIQFYERKEIKDLLAHLKLIINPFDRTSLFRVINTPTRGLGEKFEEQLRELWILEPLMNFHEILRLLLQQESLSASKVQALNAFLNTFTDLYPGSNPAQALEQIIKKTQYRGYIQDCYEKEDATGRLENITELIEAALHFEKTKIDTVSLFLDEISLLQEKKTDNEQTDQHRILLMTLHAAKGLEFDVVMLPGLEEHTIPSTRSLDNQEALQEERRLLYVGITRAREYVLLSHAQLRSTYGRTTSTIPSRFLDELPHTEIIKDQCPYWKSIQFSAYFKRWLNITIEDTVITFGAPSRWTSTASHTVTSFGKVVAPQSPSKSTTLFKPLQPVKHATYGVGIVQKEESRPDGSVCVTVKFKEGVKKILSTFLEKQ